MAMLLGCIADDFTGATDLASMVVKQGLRAIQTIGVPPGGQPPDDAEAVVVALKTRTIPAASAVEQSLAALSWLRAAGCRRFYFKYCSTFDSTPQGNIGPVAEAFMDELGADFTIACPAFPENGRTIYKGHLFVGDVPLNESSMRHHPLTPMTDANLVRVLARQTKRKVGLIDFAKVSKGPTAVRDGVAALTAQSIGLAIADAIDNRDLETLGEASVDMPLATGGSGLAWGLAGAIRRRGLVAAGVVANALPPAQGLRAVIAGSCSEATRAQVEVMRKRHPSLRLDLALLESGRAVEAALAWAGPRVGREPILIYSTGSPEEVKTIQTKLGAKASSEMVERALAGIARGLVDDLGVGRLIVAGGETSGAVVEALGVKRLRIGAEIDPGAPWTMADSSSRERPLALALKSGNFGAPDFFLKAWSVLT
ncbi:MAG TPA: 3-oxo-tetronate kinase [Roseiarcus sp.]|nr:3-oxo-tetronate kinase [Roseiarcus sp.]